MDVDSASGVSGRYAPLETKNGNWDTENSLGMRMGETYFFETFSVTRTGMHSTI